MTPLLLSDVVFPLQVLIHLVNFFLSWCLAYLFVNSFVLFYDYYHHSFLFLVKTFFCNRLRFCNLWRFFEGFIPPTIFFSTKINKIQSFQKKQNKKKTGRVSSIFFYCLQWNWDEFHFTSYGWVILELQLGQTTLNKLYTCKNWGNSKEIRSFLRIYQLALNCYHSTQFQCDSSTQFGKETYRFTRRRGFYFQFRQTMQFRQVLG